MIGHDVGFHPMPVSVETAALCKSMAELHRHKAFKLLLETEKITSLIVKKMLTWSQSVFNVHKGKATWPDDKQALERVLVTESLRRKEDSTRKATCNPQNRESLFTTGNGFPVSLCASIHRLITENPNRFGPTRSLPFSAKAMA